MTNGQRIRIRLKGFDYRMLDQSAVEIVETAKRTGVKRGYLLQPEVIIQFIAERAYVAKHGLQDTEESIEAMRASVLAVVEEWRQSADKSVTA